MPGVYCRFGINLTYYFLLFFCYLLTARHIKQQLKRAIKNRQRCDQYDDDQVQETMQRYWRCFDPLIQARNKLECQCDKHTMKYIYRQGFPAEFAYERIYARNYRYYGESQNE